MNQALLAEIVRSYPLELVEAAATALVLVVALATPRFGEGFFRRLERAGGGLARRKTLAVALAGLAPMALRAALLPIAGVPEPGLTDEFSHLLTADTLASGRLTNPTHPMWPFFEAPHVFHRPVYASMYPPAQGVILAGGQALTGVPWIGVWLSVGLMGAALCWMLQGWLPPGWALFAALLAGLRLGTVSYWMNSYWGGAPAAIGGALALGAVARLRRRPRVIDSVLLGTGLSLLVNSRPFEAVLLGLTIGPALSFIALPSRGGWTRTATVFAPALAVLAIAGAADGYYQWRVTGSPWRLPYQVNRQTYGWPQTFYWQPALPPGTYAQETMHGYYLWERALHDRGRTLRGFALATVGKLKAFWPFFLGPALTPFVLVLPRAAADRRLRLLAAVCLVMAVALSGYGFFFAHYAAPMVGALVALLGQGMRHVRVWRWHGQPTGRAAVRLTAAVCGAMLLLAAITRPEVPPEQPMLGWRPPSWYMSAPGSPRERVREQLEAQPGRHLLLVRYPSDHDVRREWVYNGASIDAERIVWAHDMGPQKNGEIIGHFGGRRIWSLTWHDGQPRLAPYAGGSPPR